MCVFLYSSSLIWEGWGAVGRTLLGVVLDVVSEDKVCHAMYDESVKQEVSSF